MHINPYLTSDDRTCLSALSRDDKQAFHALFSRYYPLLRAYAYRFVEMEDAEEIAQDILLWLWESRAFAIVESSLSTYLFRAVRNRSLNRIATHEARRRANTFYYLQSQHLEPDIEPCQIEELARKLNEAVAALPEAWRETFVMHRFRDMSHKQIAEALGVSPQTVNYRIHQAIIRLRHDLRDYLPLLGWLWIDLS